MKDTLESKIAKIFRMSDATWEKHTNPWSVWTRFTVLPFTALALWSRIWLGHWSWLLVAVSLLWAWLNPRLFSKPLNTDNWASKAVLGERVWLNRTRTPVPNTHRAMPHLLSVVSALGLPFLVWGLWTLSIWPTTVGAILVYAGKVWFLDRMVWLYEDMKDARPEYKNWLYTR